MAGIKRQSDNPSQADYRDQIEFKDQHGRTWEAVVELSTMAPVGEPRFVAFVDRASGEPIVPPILPPPAFQRYTKRGIGQMRIDYDAWIEHQRARVNDYRMMAEGFATSNYGEKASEALEHPPQRMIDYLGKPPAAIEQIMACQRGNKWALGLPDPAGRAYPRPPWADKFFPIPAPVVEQEFPDVEFADEEPEEEYPKPHGVGRWELSNGKIVRGSRADAEDAEMEIQTAPAPT